MIVAQHWAFEVWRVRQEIDRFRPRRPPTEAEALPRPSADRARQVAKAFRRSTGVGSDRRTPREAANLSDALLEVIIDFGMRCEELGGWPDVITDSLV
eukprot:6572703-Pyramimonas_sp.AAC.1